MTETAARSTGDPAPPRAALDPSFDEALAVWIEAETRGGIERAVRAGDGASRQAFAVDVRTGAGRLELFCLRDATSGSGGSQRDAAVLRALAGKGVPVPRVVAASPSLSAVLLERVSGRSDFPNVDQESEREPTIRDLLSVAARLHALDPKQLAIAHLGDPDALEGDPLDHAARQRAGLDGILRMLEGDAHPVQRLAAQWLVEAPPRARRTSLIHSDLGPGNFLAAKGRVTALLDWEVAHWGDPMEDLAALAVRDMATPVGSLASRYAEYHVAGGAEADLSAIAWYRVFILARNTSLIALGLRRSPDPAAREPLERFQLLLLRALALCLCDVLGVDRPAAGAHALDREIACDSGAAGKSTQAAGAQAHALASAFEAEIDARRGWMGSLADRRPQKLGAP